MALVTDRLRKSREMKGWSQRELARQCGLGELQIHRYESGVTDPSTDSLKSMAEKLYVSSDYLIGLTQNPQGSVGDGTFNQVEQEIIDSFRREGWAGVIRLGAERLSK